MASLLEDLDELTLRCRDANARLYISEAVSSYRSGAFRSSIVSCWIAVCFDIIEKMRELSLAGDKEAEKQIQEVDVTRRTGDITKALKFERDLLLIAKEKFELISPLEFVDLERLQVDRNRCAHPSLTADDQAYAPSAELARLHIHSAVTHLLQHPPAQGKYALDRLLQDIESEYFPTIAKDAQTALASGPLKRPRATLVRNFVLILLKELLNGSLEYKRRLRISAALNATQVLHYEIFSNTCRDRLSTLFRPINDESLSRVIQFLKEVKNVWHHLEVDVVQRLRNYVKDLPSNDIMELEFLLDYPPLKSEAFNRVKKITIKEISSSMIFFIPSVMMDHLITIYLKSSSFDEANSWVKEMLIYIDDFTESHVRRIIESVSEKEQIRKSFQLGALIAGLRKKEKISKAEFELLLQENDLNEYCLKV